jgi:hypothetical protein
MMSWFGTNPAEKAQPYFNQIPQVAQQAYNPYIQQGQQAEQGLPNYYQELTHNPMDYYNRILEGYKPSKGYDLQSQQMMRAAEGAAASGGFLGTPADQADRAALIQSLLGNDMQQYIQNIRGIQGEGAQGLQAYGNRGYGATQNLANLETNNLASQGTLAYQGQANKNNQLQQLISALLGGGADILGSPAGGGASLGSKLLGY